MRLTSFAFPLLLAAPLLAVGCQQEVECTEEETIEATALGLDCEQFRNKQLTDTRIELGDIFVPERLIEIPVLPDGAQVVNEIYIHNAGDQPLNILEVSLNYQSDDNWTLNLDTIPDTIEGHDFAVVEVTYTAVGGIDTFAALDIYSDDVDEAEKTVAFVGLSATSGPDARVSENILDFGFQFTDTERRRIVEVRNEGDADLRVTGIQLVQSETQESFHIACPGRDLPVWDEETGDLVSGCDFWGRANVDDGMVDENDAAWPGSELERILQNPILPGSANLLDVAFVPLNLQGASAQIKVFTSDPVRPEFTIFLLGNGESALNCTPPSITVTSPSEATFYHLWQTLEINARVLDAEQPSSSLYVEMFLGDLLIENEFPDENGLVRFRVDIDENNPPVPAGLQTLTLKVSDGCPLYGYDVFVAAINFPLSQSDTDGDGYSPNQGDCNEGNSDVFPQAIEVFDGIDNDCDGTIDEDTVVWDDDCDGFCEHGSICLGPASCISGIGSPYRDCNDSDNDLDDDLVADGASINPSAAETLNFIDDDCDGIVDENTSFYDDDGDGQTEATGDCNDGNDEVFRGAIEWCDDLDNDCDGTIDDDCADPDAPPRIIGGVITDEFQVPLGSFTWAEVLVVSQDDDLSYEWTTDQGSYAENALGARVQWFAPEAGDANQSLIGEFPSILVTVEDSLGQRAFGFGNVLLSDSIEKEYQPINIVDGGCAVVGSSRSSSGWALALVGLFGLAAGVRRRRD